MRDPTIPGRTFAGHTRLRKPLADVERGLSRHRAAAALILVRQIVRLATRRGRSIRIEGRPGHWTSFELDELTIELGIVSLKKREFSVRAGRQTRMAGHFSISEDGRVSRLVTDTWEHGEHWQRHLFRRDRLEG